MILCKKNQTQYILHRKWPHTLYIQQKIHPEGAHHKILISVWNKSDMTGEYYVIVLIRTKQKH